MTVVIWEALKHNSERIGVTGGLSKEIVQQFLRSKDLEPFKNFCSEIPLLQLIAGYPSLPLFVNYAVSY